MEIHGLNKTTLLDYPEHLAATVFTGGCNFRCPFCHNADLVLRPQGQPLIPEDEVLAYLAKRKGMLEGVCITGGEPTLQPDLPEFIRKIKELGYLVKLDTNGYRPEVLESLLEEELLDYVAMDIKAAPKNYARAAGLTAKFAIREARPAAGMAGLTAEPAIREARPAAGKAGLTSKPAIGAAGPAGKADGKAAEMPLAKKKSFPGRDLSEGNVSEINMPGGMDLSRIRKSILLLTGGNIPYEFRTTVVKGIHSPEEFEEIGKLLQGCRAYYLQAFRENENIIGGGFDSFSPEEMEAMAERARKYILRVETRGI